MEIGKPKRELEVVPFKNPFPFAIPGFEPAPEEPEVKPRREEPIPKEEPNLVPA